MSKKQGTLRVIQIINYFGHISGSTWVNLWGATALIKFWLGKPIDWAFLGVIALYTTHKVVTNLTTAKTQEGDSDDKSQ